MYFPKYRLRRLRRNATLRRLVRETRLAKDDLIYPLFAVPGFSVRNPVPSIPGVFQLSVDELVQEALEAKALSIALMGDITVAARSASLSFLFAPKLGLCPDMGATHFLARRVGEARARAYALTGAPIMAEEAARIGLIAECVDDDHLMVRALELVRGLAAGPRQAFLAVRELMASACTSSLADQLEREAAAQGRLADSPDFIEGVMAFREKRPAKFGRR